MLARVADDDNRVGGDHDALRVGRPRFQLVEDIGALACYLCSEAASFITGTDILIDGGWTSK